MVRWLFVLDGCLLLWPWCFICQFYPFAIVSVTGVTPLCQWTCQVQFLSPGMGSIPTRSQFFLPITLTFLPFFFPLFCTLFFPSFFCPPLISFSPFRLPSFLFPFLSFFSYLLLFFLSFLISSAFSPTLYLIFSLTPLNFVLVSLLYQGGCYEHKG